MAPHCFYNSKLLNAVGQTLQPSGFTMLVLIVGPLYALFPQLRTPGCPQAYSGKYGIYLGRVQLRID